MTYFPIIADGALGAWALVLTYAWLLSAIICSVISRKAGYSEKWGLGTGLIFTVLGIAVWLIIWGVKSLSSRSGETAGGSASGPAAG